jgi:HEAT repeats
MTSWASAESLSCIAAWSSRAQPAPLEQQLRRARQARATGKDQFTATFRQLTTTPAAVKAHPASSLQNSLAHESPRLRMLCCKILDHTLDRDSIPALVGALADPADDVRMQAVHALACDRCKSDDVRPSAADVLPAAIRLLREDANARRVPAECLTAEVR